MKFGISFANVGTFVSGEGAARLARSAEAAGFDSLWTVEHILYPEGYESVYPYAPDGKMPGSGNNPIPDPLVWLGYAAAVTSSIGLATGISLLPERHPLTFAKEVATLDVLSGGRVTLGVGIGWLREEFDALGVPWERRGPRTEEYMEVMRRVWASDDVTFDGEFVSFRRASSNPKPKAGRVPIHIGGHSEAALKRAAERGQGWYGWMQDPEQTADYVRRLHELSEQVGRPEAMGELEITITPPARLTSEAIEQYEEAGAHRLVSLATPTERSMLHGVEHLGSLAG